MSPSPVPPAPALTTAHRGFLTGKQLRLLARAARARRDLRPVADRTGLIRPGDVILVAVLRNEMARLPHWLGHHRALGAAHLLAVDNGSDDGTAAWLASQPDVSLWSADASYRAARFGMDWANWLLGRHGRGHWCLTLDADELLLLPPGLDGPGGLGRLAVRLEAEGREGLGCLMVELYPRGPASRAAFEPGGDPVAALPWFDPGGYRAARQARFGCVLLRGGPRDRLFFGADPGAAPVLSKLPFLRWRRGMAYVASTHFALPARLNRALEAEAPRAALLHTKLLPDLGARAREDRRRGQHLTDRARQARYLDGIEADPDFWFEGSMRFEGWGQIEALRLVGGLAGGPGERPEGGPSGG